MKSLLYISGPYTGNNRIKRDENITAARARMISAMISDTWWPVCPHTHTAMMEDYAPAVTWNEWLQLDIAMLAGCDALWATVRYDMAISNGVALEVAWAMQAGMPLLVEEVRPQRYPVAPTVTKNSDGSVSLNAEMGRELGSFVLSKSYRLGKSADKIAAAVAAGEIPDPRDYKGSNLGGMS